MKLTKFFIPLLLLILSCDSSDDKTPGTLLDSNTIKYLALGDSYTIGTSVCTTCKYPSVTSDSIEKYAGKPVDLQVIASNGWRTDDLLENIASTPLDPSYDLVTLLIGVNNQFQGRPFTQYESEFPLTVSAAISAAGGDASKVLVISIPDYRFTPQGQQGGASVATSNELDNYNSYAEQYATQRGVSFISITDISRLGLQEPDLVAPDGLHPSTRGHILFTERILPLVLEKLNL